MKPTPEGVTLTTQRFYYLYLNGEDLTADTLPKRPVRRERRHLGYHYYATRLSDGCVALRYDKEDNDTPPMQDFNLHYDISAVLKESPCKLVISDLEIQRPHWTCEVKEPPNKKVKVPNNLLNSIEEFDDKTCDYIKLSWAEMKMLISKYDDILNVCYDLRSCVPCITDHHNQMAYYQCSECCPLGLQEY